MPGFGGPVFSSALSRKINFSSLNSMSRIREGRTWRFHCVLYMCNLYKMPGFGGPVFSSALSSKTNFSSLNSMSRIREGRTWMFHCNLYLYVIRFLKIKRIWDSKFYGETLLSLLLLRPLVFIFNYLLAL